MKEWRNVALDSTWDGGKWGGGQMCNDTGGAEPDDLIEI